MIAAEDATVWANYKTKQVEVARGDYRWPRYRDWEDPIGVAYGWWKKGTGEQRMRWLLEAALYLAAQGFDLRVILTAFAEIAEFRALGRTSDRMCGALTWALLGTSYSQGTMTFGEILEHHARKLAKEDA